jgi:hypothetical protein
MILFAILQKFPVCQISFIYYPGLLGLDLLKLGGFEWVFSGVETGSGNSDKTVQ